MVLLVADAAPRGLLLARTEEEKGTRLKWTLITGLDEAATQHDDRCRTDEVWAGVLTETPLSTEESVPAFLEAAARYCNERLW